MQHKSRTRKSRPLTNPGTIVITESGYLASLPNSGPGLVMRSKLIKLIFDDAVKLGWNVEVADFGRRGAKVSR